MSVRALLLWLVVAVPFALGVVAGWVVRFAVLLWAAVCEGYLYGRTR